MLKFDMLVRYGSIWGCEIVKIHFHSNSKEGVRRPNFQFLNHYNSAAGYSISLKFGRVWSCDRGYDKRL